MAEHKSLSCELDDLSLLAYAEHMAETAQSESARQLFELYVRQERTRLEAGGVFRPAAGFTEHTGATRMRAVAG